MKNETTRITKRHEKKLTTLINLKRTADGIEENPNETIVNLTEQSLTQYQLDVLKLGLRYGLATRPNQFEVMSVAEDVWDQISRLNLMKEGHYIQDKIKNSLRAFTFSYIDLDLQEFKLGRKKIQILNDITVNFAILKPDKGNGIVVMKRSDYISSVKSLFTNSQKFTKLTSDPTTTNLASLQSYLHTLLKRNEITQTEYEFMRPTAAHFGRAHGIPKIHKQYLSLPTFRPIIDTTNTPHYNVGKFLSRLLNPLTSNEFSLTDSFDAVNSIQNIPKHLFNEGYQFVSFDIQSLFTNVPLNRTIKIILDRIYDQNQIQTTLKKRTLKKLISDCCSKTAFSFGNEIYKQTDGVSMGSSLGPVLANIILTEFEKTVVQELINCGTIKYYKRYVDDTLLLIKPSNIPALLKIFNKFDENLKFTVDKFPEGIVHFLDIKISVDGTDIYRKDTHTGQYTHFSSFEPFQRKTAWIRSLFDRTSKICSSTKLFENQIKIIKSFMSWNGYPKSIRNSLINKLKRKHNCATAPTRPSDENLPKIWIRLPYQGTQGTNLIPERSEGY